MTNEKERNDENNIGKLPEHIFEQCTVSLSNTVRRDTDMVIVPLKVFLRNLFTFRRIMAIMPIRCPTGVVHVVSTARSSHTVAGIAGSAETPR